MKDRPVHPKHPDRICWGCDRYCPVDDPACGNGNILTAHLAQLFGEDWLDWVERRIEPRAIEAGRAGARRK